MLREGLGKRAAAFNRQRQFAENFFEHGAAFLLFEHAQSAQERQTRVHQCRQLPRERGQNLRFDLSAQPRDGDVEVEGAAFFAAGPGGGPGTLGSEFFIPNFFGFDDFGREQAHFLDPANGLVLAGDFNRAFRFLATVVQSDVIVFRHSGMGSAPNAFGGHVYLTTSSIVVSPSKMLRKPSSRSGTMPSSIAFCRNTIVGARSLINNRTASLMMSSSKMPFRPL